MKKLMNLMFLAVIIIMAVSCEKDPEIIGPKDDPTDTLPKSIEIKVIFTFEEEENVSIDYTAIDIINEAIVDRLNRPASIIADGTGEELSLVITEDEMKNFYNTPVKIILSKQFINVNNTCSPYSKTIETTITKDLTFTF